MLLPPRYPQIHFLYVWNIKTIPVFLYIPQIHIYIAPMIDWVVTDTFGKNRLTNANNNMKSTRSTMQLRLVKGIFFFRNTRSYIV